MSSLRLFSSLIFICVIALTGLHAGSIQGVVHNAENNTTISGAHIKAISATANGDSLSFSAMSDADGRYTINGMAPLSYMIWCEHPDYMPAKENNVVVSENAILSVNFTLNRHYPAYDTRLSGIVFSAPEMLPAFIPLPGATVTLQSTNYRFETHSANDGSYSFTHMPPGDYKLTARAIDHQLFESPDIISIKEGNYIDDFHLYLTPLPYPTTSTIYGKITDPTANTPVYPAYITIIPLYYTMIDGPLPPEPEIYAVINNPDGGYIVENIPSGDYLMICSAQTYKWQRIEAIKLADQKVEVNFFLKKLDPAVNNLISGTIYEYPTRGKVLPLVDVYLSFVDTGLDRPEILHHCLSDGFGHYQFHDFYSGEAVLQFSKLGYEPLRDTLTVSADTWLINQDYSLKPFNQMEPIVLEGFVYDLSITTELRPVYPAHIQLYTVNSTGENIRYETVTHPDGSYRIRGIKSGTYTVICSAMGYEKEVVSNLVLKDPVHRLDFHLKPLDNTIFGYVSGRVYFDKLNEPVAGALISFLPLYSDLARNDAAYHTTTGPDGYYKMKLPQGGYIVSCQYRGADGWYFYQEYYNNAHTITDATPVEVYPGQIIPDINFGIPYPAIVSSVIVKGHVSDDAGQALTNALVNVRPFDLAVRAYGAADNVYQTRTDNLGNYILEINLYWLTIPTPVLGFIVSTCKEGYLTEFYKEKRTAYEADILWAFSDTTFSGIDFTLDPLSNFQAIQGTISSETGTAIAQAFVIGVHAASGEVAFTVSDNTGAYNLSGLKRGYYFLLFVASGYLPEFYDDVRHWEEATPVWVEGLVSDIDAVLTLMPVLSGNLKGVLSGRICDREGNPLSGAMVTTQLRDGPVSGYCMSDGDGMFQIPWADAGDYLVSISKVNYSSYTAWINLNTEGASNTAMLFNLESTFTDLPDRDPGEGENTLPKAYRLYGNYPNPFNPLTHIQFDLPVQQQVNLIIYDILGHRIRELLSDVVAAGNHTVTWDGTDLRGNPVSSGIYFYVLQTPDTRLVGKMVLQK